MKIIVVSIQNTNGKLQCEYIFYAEQEEENKLTLYC